jgi:integrase
MAGIASDNSRPYRINKRTYSDGKTVFYAQFQSATGSWSKRRSTGKTTRGAAEKWCLRQLKSGKATAIVNGDTTLSEYAHGFWGAGGRYDRERRARGYTLSHVYLENSRRSFDKYIEPAFGHFKLWELTPARLDTFFLDLFHDSGLSGSTVNSIMKSLRAPLREAERLGYLDRSPMRAIQIMSRTGKERGALTQEELNKLFAPDALTQVWKGRRIEMVVSMIAAGCGLRLGEAMALRPKDVENGILRVTRQFDRNGGTFKPPKWNSVREVPVPPRLQEELERLKEHQSIGDDELYTAGIIPTRPYTRLDVIGALREALEEIGIPKEEQKRTARFLDYHALRHTYITRLRAEGVPDWMIQSAAGHKSIEMTDNYTHGRGADYAAISTARIIPFGERSA